MDLLTFVFAGKFLTYVHLKLFPCLSRLWQLLSDVVSCALFAPFMFHKFCTFVRHCFFLNIFRLVCHPFYPYLCLYDFTFFVLDSSMVLAIYWHPIPGSTKYDKDCCPIPNIHGHHLRCYNPSSEAMNTWAGMVEGILCSNVRIHKAYVFVQIFFFSGVGGGSVNGVL